MEVIKWLDREDLLCTDPKEPSIGGLGGWVRGQNWDEYLKNIPEDRRYYYKALRRSIVEKKLRCGGDDHQNHFIPLFKDGTTGEFSFRAWGDLMAAIWNTEEKTNKYSYIDFYMGCIIEEQANEEITE